jgi:hypothetical protein
MADARNRGPVFRQISAIAHQTCYIFSGLYFLKPLTQPMIPSSPCIFLRCPTPEQVYRERNYLNLFGCLNNTCLTNEPGLQTKLILLDQPMDMSKGLKTQNRYTHEGELHEG